MNMLSLLRKPRSSMQLSLSYFYVLHSLSYQFKRFLVVAVGLLWPGRSFSQMTNTSEPKRRGRANVSSSKMGEWGCTVLSFWHAIDLSLLLSFSVYCHPEANIAPVLQAVGVNDVLPTEAMFKLQQGLAIGKQKIITTWKELDTYVRINCVWSLVSLWPEQVR